MKIKKKIILPGILFLVFLTACGGKADNVVTGRYYNPRENAADTKENESVDTNSTEELENSTGKAQEQLGTDQFMILTNDMQEECMTMEQIASGKEYIYYYSIATKFLDKYGDRQTVSYFEPGRVVTVGDKDTQGRVLQFQISDCVWEYPDVTRYSVDEARGIFKIGDEKYSCAGDVFISSDAQMQNVSELTDMDTLRVVGIGKKIISIAVTTGHGEIALENTDLFEGSFIQVGSKIFAEVTPNMTLEVPSGTYTVTVANNGYGGSREVTVESGETQTLDLETLKGEGPKMGNILFAVDVEGALLQIDGKVVEDYSEPVPLQYGVHTLTVDANSYAQYSKRLFVNSEEATIVIGMEGEGTGLDTASTEESTTETAADASQAAASESDVTPGSLAGSLAGSQSAGTSTGNSSGTSAGTSTSTGTTGSTTTDTTGGTGTDTITGTGTDTTTGTSTDTSADYLSTLSELLSGLSTSN